LNELAVAILQPIVDQRQQIAVQQLSLLDRPQAAIFLLAAALREVDDLQSTLEAAVGLGQPDDAHRTATELADERIAWHRLVPHAVFQGRSGLGLRHIKQQARD